MNNKISNIIKQLLLPILSTVLIVALSAPAAAEQESPGGDKARGAAVMISTANVTIGKKNSNMVKTTAGQIYKVTDNLQVVGEDGRSVMLQYLFVPCDAKIIYKTQPNGQKVVHRITVRRTHEGASNSMWKESR